MKLLRTVTIFLMGSLIFMAAAVLHAENTPPIEQANPFYLQDYSIMPPQGSNWQVLQRNQNSIVFGKDLKSKTHTFITSAIAAPMEISFENAEDFLEFVKKAKDEDTDPQRFRTLENEITLDNIYGTYCVRYHQKAEDHGAPVSGREGYLILDAYGYTFMHPDVPGLVIDMGYSERFSPGENNPELHQEGERFIRGVEFSPVDSE